MLLDELIKLVAKGESENLEFKKTTGQRSEAAKTVCALLNGLGGFVIFGISDKGQISGQQANAKTLEDITLELRKIEPPAFPEIETLAIGNDKVVIIIRVSGKLGTYCYDGRPYIRHGPTTQIMPRGEYDKRVLDKSHAHRRWENELAPDWVTVRDLDEEEIQTTLKNAIKLGRMKKPSYTDSESILRGLGLFDDGHLINAAVALYGKNNRLFSSYPQLSIRLARFRDSDRLSGFMDNRDYWGSAFNLLKRGELFLIDHIPISGRVVPGKMIREDYPLYPPLATREALANAICHRDYLIPGGAVAIAMYDDRLEIINPGVLHFDMTPEKLAKPHESKPWNPIIANVFYRAGIIEKWGMGTLNIIDWCKENGNPKPTWEVRAESVITTFLPSVFFATGQTPEELEQSRPKIRPKLRPKIRPKLLEENLEELEQSRPKIRPKLRPKIRPKLLEEDVIHLLRKGPLSKAEIAHQLGHQHISGALKKTFQSLLDRGIIVYTIPDKPRSKTQKYKLKD